MSFYTYYQAMPDRSRLLERLRSEKMFCLLYTRLIPHGPGPFHLDALDPDELAGILEDLSEDERFGSRKTFRQCLSDVTTELADAVRIYPGLENRAAYIEKLHAEIEKSLTAELRRRGAEDDVKLMRDLLYGGDALASDFFGQHERQLYLVPTSNVARGARILERVEPSEQAHGISDYAYEQFRDWKRFVVQASDRHESIIIFPTG